jgi:hypothetical protein
MAGTGHAGAAGLRSGRPQQTFASGRAVSLLNWRRPKPRCGRAMVLLRRVRACEQREQRGRLSCRACAIGAFAVQSSHLTEMGNHRVRFGLQFATVPDKQRPRSGYGWEIGPRCRGSEIAREMWRRRKTGKAVWETRRPFSFVALASRALREPRGGAGDRLAAARLRGRDPFFHQR